MNDSTQIHEIRIRATPDQVWQALADPELTRRYWYNAVNRSTWTPGAPWTSESGDGELYLEGEILEADPPRRLVQTFHVVHEPAAAAEQPSKMTFEIRPIGDDCVVRTTHENLGPATAAYVTGGWEHILSELKRLLESASPVAVGGATR